MADRADWPAPEPLPDYRYVDGEAQFAPGIPGWERVRRALRATAEEWVGVRVLHPPGGHAVRLRTTARTVDVVLPDAGVDDADWDLWGFVQDEVERRAAAERGG